MSNKKHYFYFDEIQEIDNWEYFALRIANQGLKVDITGSNAKMLSREIEGKLGGRYISKEILLLKHGEIIGSGNPESLEKELYGIVYEKKVTVEQLKEIQDKYLVAGIREEGNQVVVRYLDSKSDEETTVWPTLDDVYLYHFYKE